MDTNFFIVISSAIKLIQNFMVTRTLSIFLMGVKNAAYVIAHHVADQNAHGHIKRIYCFKPLQTDSTWQELTRK
jgi:hypothetical protein